MVHRRRRSRRSAEGNGARNGGNGWRRLRRQSEFSAPNPVVSLPSASFEFCNTVAEEAGIFAFVQRLFTPSDAPESG